MITVAETTLRKFTNKAAHNVLADEFGNLISDTIGHSIVVTDIDHYLIHTGKTWVWSDKVTVANGVTKLFLIKNGATSAIHVKEFNFTSLIGNADLYIYSAPTITTNGTERTLANKHLGMQGDTPYSKVYEDPTVSANGTQKEYFQLPGSKQSGGSISGGNDEWIIPANVNFIFSYTNNGPGTDTVGFSIKILDVGDL